MENLIKNFTTSERNCYYILLRLEAEMLKMSLREFSEYSNYSTATVKRMLAKLGFNTFDDYKDAYLQTEPESTVLNSDIEQSVVDIIHNFDQDVILSICQKILKAKKVYVVGIGLASSLATDFSLHLSNYHDNVTNIDLTLRDTLYHDPMQNNSKNLIIYFSYSGHTHEIDDIMHFQQNKNFQILLTCNPTSRSSKYCDMFVCTNTYHLDNHLHSYLPLYVLHHKILISLGLLPKP